MQLAKLLAPFMPFLAEDLYQRLPIEDKKESVHLEDWPTTGVAASSILDNMDIARKVVEVALNIRAQHNLKVRQPLLALTFQLGAKHPALQEDVLAIIRDEVNVKVVAYDEELNVSVENNQDLRKGEAGGVLVALDIKLTQELKEEGELRDIIRLVQEARKKNNFIPQDMGVVTVTGSTAMTAAVKKYEDILKKTVGASRVTYNEGDTGVEIRKA